MKKTLLKLIVLLAVIGLCATVLMESFSADPENVVITGNCLQMESGNQTIMVKDQLLVVEIHSDKIEGIIRRTGEQVICPRSLVIAELGKYRKLPIFLQPEEEVLTPLTQLKVEENGIKDLKNKNLLLSGTCKSGEEDVVYNQEPGTVLDTERIKGKYFISMFLYASSKKVICGLTDISIGAASDSHIEAAKLRVMNPEKLLGKTLLLTGICKSEAADDNKYQNLISARAKIIDVEFKDGRPVRLRAGVESLRKIVNCGDNNGKFVLEPYIPVSTTSGDE